MNIEPYGHDIACAGPDVPACEQIDDLIKLLVTIRERWGNTAIRYRIHWGGSAGWAEDDQNKEIARLKISLARLKAKLKRSASGRSAAGGEENVLPPGAEGRGTKK